MTELQVTPRERNELVARLKNPATGEKQYFPNFRYKRQWHTHSRFFARKYDALIMAVRLKTKLAAFEQAQLELALQVVPESIDEAVQN